MFKYLKYVVINLLLLSFFVDTAYAKIKRKGGSKTKNSTNELSVEELEKQGWITNKNVFQIEISRYLYMDENNLKLTNNFNKIRDDFFEYFSKGGGG